MMSPLAVLALSTPPPRLGAARQKQTEAGEGKSEKSEHAGG
jgi:hypothetical protein